MYSLETSGFAYEGLLVTILLALASMPSGAQHLDLLIKNGHVVDPKNGRDSVMDVGIAEGKIAVVARDVPLSRAAAE